MKYQPEVQSQLRAYTDTIRKIKLANADLIKAKKTMATFQESNPNISNVYIYVDYEVNLSFSIKGKDDMKAFLRHFAKNGMLLKDYHASDVRPVWVLQGINTTISVRPDWPDERTEGATCRKIIVGTETREYPIYKIVCDDGLTPEVTE